MQDLVSSAVHYFLLVHQINEFWPNATTTGLLVSLAMLTLALPVLLALLLRAVWCAAAVGRMHKTLTTTLIFAFGVPLYFAVGTLVLAVVWIILGFAILAVAIVGPVAGVSFFFYGACMAMVEFVNAQRLQTEQAEDISCLDLLLSLLVGLLCLCSFGVAACALTLVKSPVLLLAAIGHVVYHSTWLFKEAGPWCPLVFFGWCFAFIAGIVVFFLVVLVSALSKLVLAIVWPAYVAAGVLTGLGRRNSGVGRCTPVREGLKAGYQVLWAGDAFTNGFIIGDYDLVNKTAEEFMEIARGERTELSAECRWISWLPPVTIGLFRDDTWDVEAAIARQAGVSKDSVGRAWRNLQQGMANITREAVSDGLISVDFVRSVPPSLVIGIPARAFLDTIDRSKATEGLKLADGFVIHSRSRPRGPLADKVWNDLMQAKSALKRLDGKLKGEARAGFCALLLAGGGDAEDLPPGLATAVCAFEFQPEEIRSACAEIHKPLVAVALECSRQAVFRERVSKVFQDVDLDKIKSHASTARRPNECLACGSAGCGLCDGSITVVSAAA